MSTWSVAASLFFSVSLFSSAYEAVQASPMLAGAGNPAAVQRGLTDFVSRMGNVAAEVPSPVAAAHGSAVIVPQASPARLAPEISWTLAQGDDYTLDAKSSGLLGLGDGTNRLPVKQEGWQDDNDQTIHAFNVSKADHSDLVFIWKTPTQSTVVSWRSDPSGKLILTVVTDASGVRVVPNVTYAKLFASEIVYWDKLVPVPPAAVAVGTN
jgi:hypothetical protein